LYASPGISRTIRPRGVRLGGGGHITHMVEKRHACGFIVKKAKKNVQLGFN